MPQCLVRIDNFCSFRFTHGTKTPTTAHVTYMTVPAAGVVYVTVTCPAEVDVEVRLNVGAVAVDVDHPRRNAALRAVAVLTVEMRPLVATSQVMSLEVPLLLVSVSSPVTRL